MDKFEDVISFIKVQFPGRDFIPLHEAHFVGNEKKYLNATIDSTYVSSVGEFVNLFEEKMIDLTGAKYAVATVNGTSALHMSMIICGIKENDEVLSQALTFIATANAISYIKAVPVFIDVDIDTLGMSPNALINFLETNCEQNEEGITYNKKTKRKIAACIPMHTFGLPARINEIAEICKKWNIVLIEDSAESIGSYYKGKHTGTFGRVGVFSFNGNKTITCGGGGAIITNDENLAKKAKHLTTQAKIPHRWEFRHDSIGYNYRMPNLNAALACAQLETLNSFLNDKRKLSNSYRKFFDRLGMHYIKEINDAKSNYWLNAIILEDKETQQQFLEATNNNGVMTRPIWSLMNTLSMFNNCEHDGLKNSNWLVERVVNLPSSVRI